MRVVKLTDLYEKFAAIRPRAVVPPPVEEMDDYPEPPDAKWVCAYCGKPDHPLQDVLRAPRMPRRVGSRPRLQGDVRLRTSTVMRMPLQFAVEVADTPETRERGLMDRTSSTGMLFLFDATMPARASFWNKRTLLPLDLFYIDAEGRVVARHAMRSIYESYGVPVQYLAGSPFVAALELPRGRAPANVQRILVGPRDAKRAIVTVS